MKRVITIILLSVTIKINAQTIHASYNPDKNGIGIIAELPVYKQLSVLTSFEKGTYHMGEFKCNVKKYGAGLKLNWMAAIYQYNQVNAPDPFFFNLDGVKTHSLELGGLVQLHKSIGWGLLYDVINNECRLTISYKLK